LEREYAQEVQRIRMPRLDCKCLFIKDFRLREAPRAVELQTLGEKISDHLKALPLHM
jgi:hypothetical protein